MAQPNKIISPAVIQRAVVDSVENAYLADGTYFAGGTVDASGGVLSASKIKKASIKSRISSAVKTSDIPKRLK